MAQALPQGLDSLFKGFNLLSNARKIGLIASAAALVAIVVVAVLWARTPEYRVLYLNLGERDGGEVVTALGQMNVPYQFSDSGTLMVPAAQVYDVRLRLAEKGLPRGGEEGFELIEKQKFGISQYNEKVNYQRALAGELARTIQSLGPVQSARVHLAIPEPSVFARDDIAPSASVFLTLHGGRALDRAQVMAIQHLVASSVPKLGPRAVTVVDQGGNLLSAGGAAVPGRQLDDNQMNLVQAVERKTAVAIVDILKPLVGADNVRAQVSAALDFSEQEQSSEEIQPNTAADRQAVRSSQSVETASITPNGPGGVPGALSNQPPGAATAPLTAGATPGSPAAQATSSVHKESTVNYEVSKTVTHTRREIGTVKRLSAAVVVNYRRSTDKDGKPVTRPLSPQEIAQFETLARQAMGFNRDRGDSLNLVNAAFATEPEPLPTPLWERPDMIARGIEVGKVLLAALALLVAARMIRGALRDLREAGAPAGGRTEPTLGDGEGGEGGEAGAGAARGADAAVVTISPEQSAFDADMVAVRALAKENPRLVANILRDWVTKE